MSLRILPCVLGPLPRQLLRCTCPFLPPRQRPSPRWTGSALHNARAATSARRPFRGWSSALMFRPAGVLTTQVAPTATASAVGQPWFLRPSLSRFVTSPCPGYACRPNRAIDGRGPSPHQMRSLVGCGRLFARLTREKAKRIHCRRAVTCAALFSPKRTTVALPMGVRPTSSPLSGATWKWSSHRSSRGWKRRTTASLAGSGPLTSSPYRDCKRRRAAPVGRGVLTTTGDSYDLFHLHGQVEHRFWRMAISQQ